MRHICGKCVIDYSHELIFFGLNTLHLQQQFWQLQDPKVDV